MRLSIFTVCVLLILAGCSSIKTTSPASPEVQMQKADNLYQAKKYAKAALIYQEIVFERNSSIAADAQIKLADSYYYLNKFADALVEYEQLIKLFPDFKDIHRAYYMIGVCYFELSLNSQLTQEDTQKSIDAFQIFIDKYPSNKLRTSSLDYLQKAQIKLLEKEYNNGYIYYKMNDYSSSLMYFKELIDLGNKDTLELKSLYYTARIYINQKNWKAAREIFNKMKMNFQDDKHTRKIQRLLTSKNQMS